MIAGSPAVVTLTGRAAGDLGPASADRGEIVDRRRREIAPGSWRWLNQVHGRDVVVVGPCDPLAGAAADAVVSTAPGRPIAVFGADCPLLGLWSTEGVAAVAHAGWRGLRDGILEATVASMRDAGATGVVAVIGPMIGPECYEFGDGELGALEELFGPCARAETRTGRPALDLRACVHVVLERLGVDVQWAEPTCTACDERWFSWRGRKESGRHALVLSTEEP